jgi:hypothetical protein
MNNTGQAATSSSYNPTAVIAAAHAKLSAGDWEGGQFIFQSSLLEWTDDAREAAGQAMDHGNTATHSSDYLIPEQQREAVATLWLAYAQYLIDAKQYKSATQAYADAVSSVVARRVGRVHAAAARYALERSQRQTARRIYQTALVGGDTAATSPFHHPPQLQPLVDDEQDRDLLWQDFLDMMRVTKPELTMAELQSAVMNEATTALLSSSDGSMPPAKRFKETLHSDAANNSRNVSPIPNAAAAAAAILQYQDSSMESQTHVVTLESVQELQNVVYASWVPTTTTANNNTTAPHSQDASSQSLPPDVRAAWMSRDGHALPLEPPAPSLFRPAPPKLSDPVRCFCGKDNCGRAFSVSDSVLVLMVFHWCTDIQGYLGIGHGHSTRTASTEPVGRPRVGSVSRTVDAAGLDRAE